MNPWTAIGYLALAAIALVAGLAVLFVLDTRVKPWAFALLAHRSSRRIPPEPAHVWMQGSTYLTITRIADNGRICMTTKVLPNSTGASWSDSPEEWQERMTSRRLWLLRERCEWWARHLGLDRKATATKEES